jgi:magnesium-transporting ATPase (P-type)
MTSEAKRQQAVADAHARSIEDVLQDLNAGQEGLSSQEAADRLAKFGPNRLPAAPKEGLLKRFFKHFHDLLIYVLVAAAFITALLGHWIDTGVIVAVVVINAIIGFVQEGKAEQALEGIRKMLSLHARARRDGEWADIQADAVVPGDLVRLHSGDRVPADVRLIEAVNLRIDRRIGSRREADRAFAGAQAWAAATGWPIRARWLPPGVASV